MRERETSHSVLFWYYVRRRRPGMAGDTYTLGIDGGGTRCRARLRDASGRLAGEAEGGLANVYQDFEGALRSIVETAREACAAAGLAGDLLARCRAGLGLAGVTDAARGAQV